VKLKLKKKIRRKSKKPYFGKHVHESVVDFQETKCQEERHEIYEVHIRNAFEKLSENLIYIYGFSRDAEHFKILKSDCVSFLYETLEKFDASKGSKAFSYFNVCAKNHLLAKAKKTQKRKIRNISLSDITTMSRVEKTMVESHSVIPSPDDLFIRTEDKEILKEMLQKIRVKVSNENEKVCISAIITLFDNIEELEFLNKRAVFVYLREISGLNPKQLSVALSSIRKHYREIVKSDDLFMLFGS
jgi:hypothetical protein|tara:strand:- start:1661 stop:2392 length:732 start_codon:yes stop_codon:yes gene_type:complete